MKRLINPPLFFAVILLNEQLFMIKILFCFIFANAAEFESALRNKESFIKTRLNLMIEMIPDNSSEEE